jgi:exoribonuclease R
MTATDRQYDLREAARELMVEHGLQPTFPPEVFDEIAAMSGIVPGGETSVRDMRGLLWSSIDNRESRDLDQIEYVEMVPANVIRVLVGIADVDVLVPKQSAVDAHAAQNTTSVYAGVIVFPMLPDRLSTDLTSLNEKEDRVVVVVQFDVRPDGSLTEVDVYRAYVHNHAKLDYETVGAWLSGHGPAPPEIARNAALEQQVRWQSEAAARLRELRHSRGALHMETIEARPVVVRNRVIDLQVVKQNSARDLIEAFMVGANTAIAEYLVAKGVPALRRVVRTPRRWDRIVEVAAELNVTLPPVPDSKALAEFLDGRKDADPDGFPDLSLTIVKLLGAGEYVLERRMGARRSEGHFALAVAEYTHSTAPNRRFPDLVIQRLVKATVAGSASPYTDAELAGIAAHCTEQEDAARKVERGMRKKAAAVLMNERIGESFVALVTGASEKGTYVRLLSPPVEGRVIRGSEALDVGATVRVRLARVDVERGYIDFETASTDVERKLERSRRKKKAAASLAGRIGEMFDASVTGASDKGVYVRTVDGIEGRVMRGHHGLVKDQQVRLRLVRADATHGFIDFENPAGIEPRKVERAERKKDAARRLQSRIGEAFVATVTSVTRKAVWIRTVSPDLVEGRLVRGGAGLHTNDIVDVILLNADPELGHIDFTKAEW